MLAAPTYTVKVSKQQAADRRVESRWRRVVNRVEVGVNKQDGQEAQERFAKKRVVKTGPAVYLYVYKQIRDAEYRNMSKKHYCSLSSGCGCLGCIVCSEDSFFLPEYHRQHARLSLSLGT